MTGLQVAPPSKLPRRGEVRDTSRQPDDLVLYSVTTCLGVLEKPALVPWAVNVTADRVVERFRLLQRRLEEEGPESAVKYVRDLRWDNGGNLSDAALGTLAHKLFDTYALDGRRPAVTADLHPDFASKGKLLTDEDVRAVSRMLDQFDRFLQTFQPDYLGCETVVYHSTYGYGGQADAWLSIDGVRLIADYKTSRTSYTAAGKEKAPYPEAGLQLAAYRYAEAAAIWRARRYSASGNGNRSRRYYLLNEDERAAAVPVPEVDGGVVIHVSPDRFGVYPARCGEREHAAFLYTLECARWLFNEAGNVIGDEMAAPYPLPETGDPFAGLPTD